jgi:DNA-binding MarR family transcriptional regulator
MTRKGATGSGKTAPPQASEPDFDYGLMTELVGYNLRRAQALVFDDFMKSLSKAAMTPGQFGVLALIAANPDVSQTTLANALGIERSTMVAVIDRLEKQGLVARKTVAHDRRTNALTLTDAGRKAFARLKPLVRKHDRRICGDLSDDEVATLIDLLRRVGHK